MASSEKNVQAFVGDPRMSFCAGGMHPYRLLSYLRVFKEQRAKEWIETITAACGHPENIIMDSGAFTLQFGGMKGFNIEPTYDAYAKFTEQYLADLERWDFKGIVIEMDVQRLLGVADTEKLRRMFSHLGPRVMYVWHQPDGPDGMDELARRYDFVSFSFMELNVISGTKHKQAAKGNLALTRRMSADLLKRIHGADPKRKPPRVHLLGCTQRALLESRHAWSGDSSAWLQASRYGKGMLFEPERGIITVHVRSRKFERWRSMAMSRMPEFEAHVMADPAITPDLKTVYLNAAACAYAYTAQQA
ncbi:MAG: hypothetical protein K2X68_09955, partial [Novosphingobium sp.]|nr:hypothetical protein [Novosphingobium sp.]